MLEVQVGDQVKLKDGTVGKVVRSDDGVILGIDQEGPGGVPLRCFVCIDQVEEVLL